MTALLAACLAGAGAAAVRAVLRAGDRTGLVGMRRPVPMLRVPAALTVALEAAAVPASPAAAWSAWTVASSVAVVGGLLLAGPVAAVVAVAVAVVAPVLALAAMRGRAVAQVEAQLPDLLDAVARSLRSGSTVQLALVEAAPAHAGRLGDDLARVLADAAGGLALDDALEAWAVRCPCAGVRLAVAALGLAGDAGGSAARAVDGVAATLRSNLALAGEVRAQSSQARLSAMVIAAAPLAFGALAAGTDGRTADFLLRTPFGLVCVSAGLALDAAAAWWMHRITAAPS